MLPFLPLTNTKSAWFEATASFVLALTIPLVIVYALAGI